MPEEQLSVIAEPSGEDVSFLAERIYEYNVAQTGLRDGRLFGIFVRDDEGTIVAGLDGWTWGGYLYVDHLWVHESLRGQGHGSRLLETAERDAVAHGCRHALLSTHSFQASIAGTATRSAPSWTTIRRATSSITCASPCPRHESPRDPRMALVARL